MKLILPARISEALSPMAWLKRAHQWFEANAGDQLESARVGVEGNGHAALFLRLHPAAEEVSVVAAGEGRVVVAARTSSVGPGYHRYLVDLVQKMGRDLELSWAELTTGVGDPTGYFDTHDGARLEERMLAWLSESVEQAIALRRVGQYGVAFSLRYGHTYSHSDAALLTPLGPRDDAWLKAVQENPRNGQDVFPWWDPGQRAPTRLRSALIRLWTQMVWRPPLLDEERKLFQEIAQELESAWREDPTLSYPWREWREVLGYLGKGGTLAEEVSRRAAESKGPEIGYRRGWVEVALPGAWRIRIPGSLAESALPDGSWVGRDHRRGVRFMRIDGPFQPTEGADLTHQTSRMHSRATLSENSLTAYCESGAMKALCIIQFEDPEDKAFALETWRSIDALPQA